MERGMQIAIALILVGSITYGIYYYVTPHYGFPSRQIATDIFNTSMTNTSVSYFSKSATYGQLPLTGSVNYKVKSYNSTAAHKTNISLNVYEIEFDRGIDAQQEYSKGILEYVAQNLTNSTIMVSQSYGPTNYTLINRSGGYEVIGQEGSYIFGFFASGATFDEVTQFVEAQIRAM